jgi:hypothetical protein
MHHNTTLYARLALPAVLIFAGCMIGRAQDLPTVQASVPKLVLKEGTEVSLRFAQDLGSKTAVEGDPVTLTLAEDLIVDGAVVVRAGANAVGEVTNAKKAGMMGKGGELNIRLDHLNTGANKIKLRGTKGREGESHVGTAVALTVLFGPVGLLKHGKNIEITQGTPFVAYVADDVALPSVR